MRWGRKAVHVNLNALGPRWDFSLSGSGGTGYARARDGLRAFDSLADEVRRRQDALAHPPGPGAGAVARAGLGGALAAYLSTPAGQKALDGFAHAAAGLAQKFFAGGPEQLRLPLA
jgi:hypothetical protein